MANSWEQFPARHPVLVLGVIAVATLAAASTFVDRETGAARLWVDPGIEQLLPDNDPERRFAEYAAHVYRSEEPVIIAFAADDVLSLEHLEFLAALREDLLGISGVRDVRSLAELPHVQMDDEMFEVHSILDTTRNWPELRPEIAEALRNHLVWGTLISEDGRHSALVLSFDAIPDREFLAQGLDQEVRRIVEAHAEGKVDETWISGTPVLKAETSRALVRQLRIALPAIALLSAVVLFIAFGSVRGVVLPLATIALALVFTGAALVWWGRPLNLITTIVPPLLLTVGLAYGMHFMSEYADGQSEGNEPDRVAGTLGAVGLPLVLAGLTTAGGFGALAVNPLAAIREFGFLATLGTAITVLLCMTFLPAALVLWGRVRPGRRAPAAAIFTAVGEALGRAALGNRRVLIVGALVVFGLAVAATTQINVGTTYVENFAPDTRVRQDYEAIREHLGGANAFQIVIETDTEDAFVTPERLRVIGEFQEWLEAQPEIGPTISMVDYLELLQNLLMGEDGLPEDAALAKQLIMFAGGDHVQRFSDSLYKTANIMVRARVDDSRAVSEVHRRIEARLAELPSAMTGRVTGNSVLLNRTLERIARGQLGSILAAFAVIYLILALVFMSPRIALLGLLPNALPVAIFFGVLGIAGIPLNPTTSLVACIALGIAVDDTTHYMVRFGTAARRFADEKRAALETLRDVLRPVTLTTIALCGGFLVMASSELRNQVQFGMLAAFTLACAWVIDVTVTPALTAGARIATFWDVLRLDLGSEPHKEIAVFEGLTARQTRVFAMMMDIRSIRAGDLLMRQGETGVRDIYVVLEGELSVYSERDGSETPIRTARRGDLVGTMGHYSGTRNATVRAKEAARLLRIEDRDLEELLRRYPKIAGPIYRNLGHAQTASALRYIERSG